MSRKKTYTENQKAEIKRKYESMLNNLNAEVYTIDRARELYLNAIDKSNETEERTNEKGIKQKGFKYDFIGELARDLKANKDTFNYLVKKFPELQQLHNELHYRIEQNCFSNIKKNFIKEASGIVNLKSNYKWTDRTQIDLSAEQKKLQDLFPEIPE